VLRDKDHVRAERVHVCMTAHGRVSAEETLLFSPCQDRQARYDGGSIRVMVKTNSTGSESGSIQSMPNMHCHASFNVCRADLSFIAIGCNVLSICLPVMLWRRNCLS
jgi:hypothetical protein